jgi:hypothetical protein
MKNFLLYSTLSIFILASILGILLYQEGAFDSRIKTTDKKLEPFMKCEAGKCASGKCSGN